MSECTHDCSTCSSNCGERKQPESLLQPANQYSDIKKVIGVVSGKGGVGKSLVSCLLASKCRQAGLKVGILDADITGPSVPKSFGITSRAMQNETGLLPTVAPNGVKIMSINLLLEDVNSPVVWRGPVISGVIQQFWTDVNWGELDYLFVDMPPGTGDVALTVFQSLPVDGIIIVTSPQDLVGMIVAKAVNMANMMNIPVLGIVENMSYFKCPDCGKEHAIFGESKVEKIAKEYGIAHYARLPMDPVVATMVDAGEVESVSGEHIAPIVDYIEKEI